MAGFFFSLAGRTQDLNSFLSDLFLNAKLNTDLVTFYEANTSLRYQLRTGYPEYPARFSGAAQCDNHEFHFTRHPRIDIQFTDGYIAVHDLKTSGSPKTVGLSVRVESTNKKGIDSLFGAWDEILADLAEMRKTTHFPLTDESEYILPAEKVKRVLIYRNKGNANMKLTSWVIDLVIPMDAEIK